MFSKAEAKERRQAFWTTFAVYMRKHKPTNHPKTKWVNYRTGVRDLYFRLNTNGRKAQVCIDLQHNDEGIRVLFYEQWLELRKVFESIAGSEWKWEADVYDAETYQTLSRISVETEGLNYFNKEDWSALFQFFEKHMVPLDEFWGEFQEVFKQLES